MLMFQFFALFCAMVYAPLSQAYMNLFLNQDEVMRLLGKKMFYYHKCRKLLFLSFMFMRMMLI